LVRCPKLIRQKAKHLDYKSAHIASLLLARFNMSERMDRSAIQFGHRDELDEQDDAYWKNASIEEKMKTITYLRECFYGPEATTGRLQRVFEFSKLKQG
jgi:hypothetical protein